MCAHLSAAARQLGGAHRGDLRPGGPEGIEIVRESGTADILFTAAIDERLNEVGFIVPGLGDAGDRQFGLA